jgi:predicted outer membrane repeat protein
VIKDHYAEANFGGAMRINSSVDTNHVEITNCQFIDNYSPKNGGAMYLNVSPNKHLTVNITDSAFVGNESLTRGGGALGGGTPIDGTLLLQISNSRFENNLSGEDGGGIYLTGLNITGSIKNSAFIGNHAGWGGGAIMWFKTGEFSSINNTFHNNTANNYAGALYAYADIDNSAGIHIINNTITGNSILSDESSFGGGGIYSKDSKTKVSNTVIANNSAMNEAPNCSGTLGSAAYNLISDTTDCNFIADPTDMLGDDILPLDPMLHLLTDDGGSKVYQTPVVGSSLIEAGNPAGCLDNMGNRINYDQIGHIRHQDGSEMGLDRCDIGAVEVINTDVIFISLFEL